jgi:hypothetical protein
MAPTHSDGKASLATLMLIFLHMPTERVERAMQQVQVQLPKKAGVSFTLLRSSPAGVP